LTLTTCRACVGAVTVARHSKSDTVECTRWLMLVAINQSQEDTLMKMVSINFSYQVFTTRGQCIGGLHLYGLWESQRKGRRMRVFAKSIIKVRIERVGTI
jgi:hypothetical protein